MREELYATFGVYDNRTDVIHCKALLETYRQTQEEFVKNTSNQQNVNCNPVKTYPLPFNAYNLDDEKPADINTKVEKRDEAPVKEMSEEEKKAEKERVIDTIFGGGASSPSSSD